MVTSLATATRIANHPRVRDLRVRQQQLRARFVRDYGNDFMGTEDATYELNNGHEGVNRWTRPERKEYMSLTQRLHTLREALRAHYDNA